MSRVSAAAFAVPGNLSLPTGGYHYDRCLLDGLRAEGRDVSHIALPASFPFPGPADMGQAVAQLSDIPESRVLLIDGLAFGALDTRALDRIAAPIVALVHHPLAHESGMAESEARRLHALERDNLQRAAHVLVPSGYIKQVLVDEYAVEAERMTVIRPGRPEVRVAQAEAAPEGPPLILSVGLLHPRKGHDVLISALGRIADLDWRAVIVGSPWEEAYDTKLTALISELGSQDRVRLAGRVDQAELDTLYAEAHLFALATRFEGYGIVFDEALMRGLPIVSTKAGAVPGTVPDDAGLLVAPDDPAAFAEALRTLLQDRDRHAACSAAARRAGATLPSWTDAAETVGAILDRVAGAQVS
ncbi:D-inositol 3-phosphate glycosyltransferase [Roseivivax sp. THAF40]|uniref:glycosyltransferase family 4 protein n=1 Tax=Roseivivax sp. THAF40 TaxID=2587858 RepID=UPI001267CA03|nr:glycosyltransferase family 4 protein [Roseivivax sp. THAF40]QFT45607.1 D-inositol 3-phosphate glycosyltransferase [Roseivivax sp. THAF40]